MKRRFGISGTFRRRRSERERGAVLVEFVLVLPFFLYIVFLIIALSMMFSFRQAMSQAANEGAREAAITPVGTTVAERQAAAERAINAALGSQAKVTCTGGALKQGGNTVGTCTISPPTACPAPEASKQCVTVSLVHNYQDHPAVGGIPTNFPGFGFVIPDQLRISAVARVS